MFGGFLETRPFLRAFPLITRRMGVTMDRSSMEPMVLAGSKGVYLGPNRRTEPGVPGPPAKCREPWCVAPKIPLEMAHCLKHATKNGALSEYYEGF